VPTLGKRPQYLRQSLASIRSAGHVRIVLVGPASFDPSELIAAGLADEKMDEVTPGLAAAINQGFAAAPATVDYLAWLGDDDLLYPGSIQTAEDLLMRRPRSVAVYGGCDYIDENGAKVWAMPTGWWASPLLRVGPQLIPQPGSLFRRTAVQRAGALRTDLGWAFDFDFLIRLSKLGRLSYVRQTLAAFRWHPDSLSVRQREDSVREASEVRRSHLPTWLRPVSALWETPVRWATLRAAGLVKVAEPGATASKSR
jgi:GT2 family glycosyltransferase